jgi:alkylation response protein AidB-like acyl-CoA dehydrogenase
LHPDGSIGTAFIPRGTEGLVINEDWDAFGQRATVSGTAVLTDVWVSERFVFSTAGRSKAAGAFRYSRSQLTHAAIQLGIAEGLLALSDRVDASLLSPSNRSRFGVWREELVLDMAATSALLDRAAQLIDDIVAAGNVTTEAALALGIAVDEAKCIAYDLGPVTANGYTEFLDAASANDTYDIDRYWRNARVHSLHDPIRWRRHFVGNFHLNEAPPPFVKWLLESQGDSPL